MKNKINQTFIKNKTELARVRAANLKGIKDPHHAQIMGSGPLNRDGVPQLPPDQRAVTNWPVLDLGVHPEIRREDWHIRISGLVKKPQRFDFAGLMELPQFEDVSDFHCVTGWSQLGMKWRGVKLSDLLSVCELESSAQFLFVKASDGYSTNLSLEEALKSDVLLVYEWNGQALPREHGGPVRMITPQLWAWKGAKWISEIEILAQDRRGFWEERGYSNSAIPWLNDRYTADEVSD